MTKTFVKQLNKSMIIKLTLLFLPIAVGISISVASGCTNGVSSATNCITP